MPESEEPKWVHMDATPCDHRNWPDPDGGFWWCEDGRQAVRLNPKWKADNGN